ncbi:MAG TPA: threonine--tRNA ligase [Thermodesulfovibrionales bacterium]|nr:threonine--tRNA ligase [Thermodesulfovibrionales bacterium]
MLDFRGGGDIKIRYADGSEVSAGLAEAESRLKKAGAIALKVQGNLTDISSLKDLGNDSVVEPVLPDSKEGLDIYRHSASHVMAHAVKELFPAARLAIGPSTEEGFYYDFDIERPLTPEDLTRIEEKMAEIIRSNIPFRRKVIKREDAIELFGKTGEVYKVELLNEIADDEVSLYEENGFVDLCRGPHVPSTGFIKAFKLVSIAGAYWRGDEKNKMLQRIYGTAFSKEKDLKEYLTFLEEVKKRDHRKLGKELDLFSITDDIGAGLILWHPNGAIIRKAIEDFWREEHLKSGYKLLYTPHMAKVDLWKKSGHWDFYRENMYAPMEVENVEYEIKPMNCPFHIAVYKSHLRSYRDLPIGYAELGTVYRFERSGVLHGLMRVRGFTQDDAHIFAREDQMEEEVAKTLDFTLFILSTFGFDAYDIYLSTRPEKYVGTDEIWERSINALKHALEEKGLSYEVDEGGGAFYGPKIDIKIKDSLSRSWQCSTIQMDFNNPERFDVTYRGSDGREHRPIMIHRALMGSLERFFGILIEHYAGLFPVWLSPVQVALLTIAERHADYALSVANRLNAEGIRTEVNSENEKIGHKIRGATIRKIPYLVIIGDKEASEEKLSVRRRNGETLAPLSEQCFLELVCEDIKLRR